jgi:hypothetical protein
VDVIVGDLVNEAVLSSVALRVTDLLFVTFGVLLVEGRDTLPSSDRVIEVDTDAVIPIVVDAVFDVVADALEKVAEVVVVSDVLE